MIDGLKSGYREAILDCLTRNSRVEKVVLFGSRATGKHRITSDIDLCLYGEALSLDDLGKLMTELDRLAIPQQVDLLLYHKINNDKLRAKIKKQGVLWFDRES